MYKKYGTFKKSISIIILCLSILSLFSIKVYATDREHLRDTLDKQEEELSDSMKTLNPIESDTTKDVYKKTVNSIEEEIKNSKGEVDIQSKTDRIQKLIFTGLIKSRTITIITYTATWVIGVLYAATMGSRDVNKRRKAFLVIRNSTVLFLIYVNIPLFIIWLNSSKSNTSNVTLFNVVYEGLLFFQRNSIIITSLMAFSGVSRLIISKNDLPMRKQAIYLIKFSIILLVFFNLAPVAMYFLI